MEDMTSRILDTIREWGRGKIFFPEDFSSFPSPGLVRLTLMNLTDDGIIVRLARGVYCYPELEGGHSSRMVIPGPETIALAVAGRKGMRIAEYGDRAAFDLGLSGARVTDLMYLTDGAPRRVCLSGGRRIVFNHTSEVKMFGYRSPLMQKIVSAVRFLGEEAIDERRRLAISSHLRRIDDADFSHDISLPPVWVQRMLKELRDR